MKISAITTGINEWSGSVLIIGVLKGEIENQIKLLNSLVNETYLKKRLIEAKFKGESNQKLIVELIEGKIEKIVIIGLGSPENLVINDFRLAASIGTRESFDHQGKLGIFFPWDAFDHSSNAIAVSEAVRLTSFKDLRFKSEPDQITLPNELELIGLDEKANS